jgi:hypothetical protein
MAETAIPRIRQQNTFLALVDIGDSTEYDFITMLTRRRLSPARPVWSLPKR